ncbi:MAG TPA: CBS domain-containing protein [Caldimonas sp.]|jgi:predicted transcriptional regulator
MHPDSALATRRLQPPTAIAQAQTWQTDAVTLDSPALSVMTDLTKVKAATTNPGTTLRQAEQIMIYQGVRMLFVVTEMPSLEGLITSTDLHGIRAMRVIQQRNVRYDELTVADVMVSLSSLDAIDHAQMQLATVRNVVATLRKQGRNHLLVVESGTAVAPPRGRVVPSRVRGVISRAQVERQLGTVIDMIEVAQSFADIEQMLGA